MKNLSFLILLLTIITSCDEIGGPYAEPQAVSYSGNCSDTTDTAFIYTRNVLLEEFTGHTCQGCPAAQTIGQGLKSTYGERMALVSIHSGNFAQVENNADGSYSYDFKTEEGTTVSTDFGIISLPYPMGMVDRKSFSSNNLYFVVPSNWGAKVAQQLAEPPIAAIQLKTTYLAADSLIRTTVKTKFLMDKDTAYNVCVFLTEDNIINWQKFPSPTGNVPNYVHNHVLRGSLSGTYGLQLGTNFKTDDVIQTCLAGKIKHPDSKPENYHVVAFIYNAVTKEVVQAIEKKIIP